MKAENNKYKNLDKKMNNSKIEKEAYELSIYLDNNTFIENEGTEQIYQYSRDDRVYVYYASTTQMYFEYGYRNFVENEEKINKNKIKDFWYNLMFIEIKKCIAAENTNAINNTSILVSEIKEFFEYIVNDEVHEHLSENIDYIYDFKDKETNRNVLQNATFYNLTNVVKELAKHCCFKETSIVNDRIINKKINIIDLKNYIKNNQDATLEKIGKYFNVTKQAIFYHIKKHDIEHKIHSTK